MTTFPTALFHVLGRPIVTTVTLCIGLFTCLLSVSTLSTEALLKLFTATSPGPSTVPGLTCALSKYSDEEQITKGGGGEDVEGSPAPFQAPARRAHCFTSLSSNVLTAGRAGTNVKQGVWTSGSW